MERFELIAPCHFGLEAVLKREILDLGYEISQWWKTDVLLFMGMQKLYAERMYFCGQQSVPDKAGSFKAVTFDELFEKHQADPGSIISHGMESSG